MQSFRTEFENPIVERDIIYLEQKIRAYRDGNMAEDKFKSLRLARGIYGQRQPGVQMIRIKLPFGKITFKQLLRIADISDEYASSNLHLTTRQDIQIHYVSLDKTPELWAKLEQDNVTQREACGNTVRNVTASPTAGIDPLEPFDVSPYAHATFEYFLRNPICQEMGRKFKMAFSSSEADTAFSYIHDLGFVPKVKVYNGEEQRGFKVMLGGSLGAQPMLGYVVHEFLPENEVIPYAESVLRVFDRYGERNNRNKARFKFLIQKSGLDEVIRLIDEERTANKSKSYAVNRDAIPLPNIPGEQNFPDVEVKDEKHYQEWLKTNVFEQKQKGFYGVYVKVPVGDIPSDKAREFVGAISSLVADEIRITQNQGLLLKYVRKEALPVLFNNLEKLGMADPGFDSVAEVVELILAQRFSRLQGKVQLVDLFPDLTRDQLASGAREAASLGDARPQRVRISVGEDQEVGGGKVRVLLDSGCIRLAGPARLHQRLPERTRRGTQVARFDRREVLDVSHARGVLRSLQKATQPVEVLCDATQHQDAP